MTVRGALRAKPEGDLPDAPADPDAAKAIEEIREGMMEFLPEQWRTPCLLEEKYQFITWADVRKTVTEISSRDQITVAQRNKAC